MQSDVGRTYPIHAGAAGKAILAWQPQVLDRPGLKLGQVTPATITDAAKLRRELERIRQRGYAESESEMVPGAASLAVPVQVERRSGPVVVAALGIVVPPHRRDLPRLVPVLQVAARGIGRELARTRDFH